MNSYEPERINVEELDSVAEGFNKTNRNNFNLKIFLNEWINSIGEKLKNLGDSIQNLGISIQSLTKEIEKKANKTDIPTTLPANGGNANTISGVKVDDLFKIISNAITDIKDSSNKFGVGIASPTTLNMPFSDWWYVSIKLIGVNSTQVKVISVNSNREYTLIKVNNAWKDWIENPISNGILQTNLNAEMLNGKKLEYFAPKEDALMKKSINGNKMSELENGIYYVYEGNKMFEDYPKEAANLALIYGQVMVTEIANYKQYRMIVSNAALTTISEFIGFKIGGTPILWKKI